MVRYLCCRGNDSFDISVKCCDAALDTVAKNKNCYPHKKIRTYKVHEPGAFFSAFKLDLARERREDCNTWKMDGQEGHDSRH